MNNKETGSAAEDILQHRSTDDIRRDIEQDEREISETVEQIGDRISERLNWRRYLQRSPYWTLGITAAIGFVLAHSLTRRRTPVERFVDSLSEGIRESIGPAISRSKSSNLLKATLAGLGTKLITGWIRNSVTRARPGAQSTPAETTKEA